MFMYFFLFFGGIAAGLSTILFGFGGGFVVVPLLYGVLRQTHSVAGGSDSPAMHIAIATSTCVMIVGAATGTWRHHRKGSIPWPAVEPLIKYVAIGAIGGAATAVYIRGAWLHWAFAAYVGATIIDCLVQPGFTAHGDGKIQSPGLVGNAFAGTLIGAVAACLGVGGSVMTVPLMRRWGASMTAATSAAIPISLPVAVAGTATYMLSDLNRSSLGPGYVGYVNLAAFAVLAIGIWCGIRVAAPYIGRIPDAIHAKAYVAFLCLALIVMCVV